MLDPNPKEPQLQMLKEFPFLTGVVLDPSSGPITTTRRIAVLSQSNIENIREINESVTEDIYPQDELDAHYARLGWPSPNKLPGKPWDAPDLGEQHTCGTEIWASRRFMVQRATINLSPQDICAVEPFVEVVEAALTQETNSLKIQALRKVFATWGEMVPLNMVVGACLAVTGILNNKKTLPDGTPPTNPPTGDRPYNLTEIVDQYLGTTKAFARRLESRVQGGASEALLNEGYEAWLNSAVGSPESWTIVKVHYAVPVTEILSDQLRERVERLFTSSLI
ncbi:hypothetical protein RSAG8_12129, partial [Rhizoctonia solani AG-8 WAC10335]